MSFYLMLTPKTMFRFSFISHVRAALFFNVLETQKQIWNAETICFSILFFYYFTFVNSLDTEDKQRIYWRKEKICVLDSIGRKPWIE